MCVMGIDVSKSKLDSKISNLEKTYIFSNSSKGFAKLFILAKKHNVDLVVVESTGGYERSVFRYLWKKGVKVALINPRQSNAFARSLGQRAKNDLIDAEVLMLYGERMKPQPNEPISDEVSALRELLTRRNQLNKMLIAEKNHRKAPGVSPTTLKSIRVLIRSLNAQICSIDQDIHRIIDSNQTLSDKANTLSAQTGVGPVLIATLLADLPELGSLKKNQASALVGVAPYDRDSGTYKGKRSISGGRVRVRCALYTART